MTKRMWMGAGLAAMLLASSAYADNFQFRADRKVRGHTAQGEVPVGYVAAPNSIPGASAPARGYQSFSADPGDQTINDQTYYLPGTPTAPRTSYRSYSYGPAYADGTVYPSNGYYYSGRSWGLFRRCW
ncbi:MAG TPA: hypothetical protein VHB77_05865 [Planctomycetaceae bacterium]|nr:hypothetical protein [Planctomycetaceae bacterium]